MNIINMTKTRSFAGKFEVVATVYHGDGDLYEKNSLGYFDRNNDLDILDELLTILHEMNKRTRDYEDIDGFNKWFMQEDMEEDELNSIDERIINLGNEWACDTYSMQYGNSDPVTLDDYKVFYYDDFGNEFAVKFDKVIVQ